jgi:hypothetical protein
MMLLKPDSNGVRSASWFCLFLSEILSIGFYVQRHTAFLHHEFTEPDISDGACIITPERYHYFPCEALDYGSKSRYRLRFQLVDATPKLSL